MKNQGWLTYKAFFFMLAGLITWSFATAQNAPVTTIATVANAVPGLVQVPVTVNGFTNIGAVSLYIEYEYAGLHFVQGSANPLLGGMAMNDVDLGNGRHRVIVGWFGFGVTLPGGSVMVTLTFNYISGTTLIEFNDTGSSCEYADANLNVLNDIPSSSYYINGKVCGVVGNPGVINGSDNICQGASGIDYSIQPLVNATGYSWSLPPGATITSGSNTNAITVDFSPSAVSGNISVNGLNLCGNGTTAQLAVTVNPLPVANAGTNISIPYGTNTTLNAAPGGAGVFSYHWAPEAMLVNPNLQNPQTVNLTVTTVFTLTVTNQATQCQNTDDVVVTITGGPLNINPLCNPGTICRGTAAQLFANAGGGSGNYTYNWSSVPPGTPPWTSSQANPVVSPDSSRVYNLVVNDGFNNTQGSTQLSVYQLPTASISGGDTLCGEGQSTILTVHFTGTPPWSFYYTNGLLTWYIQGVSTTPFYITATLPGIYTVPAMNDLHCTGTTSGAAMVGVFPIPPTPSISTNGVAIYSSGCCGNQWYLDGTAIAGAIGQVYQPVASGHYFVIVTVNGCISDTSNVINFVVAGGIANHYSKRLTVWPNPARTHITIEPASGDHEFLEIRLLDVSGNLVKRIKDPIPQDGKFTICISEITSGFYYLECHSVTGMSIGKFCVQ